MTLKLVPLLALSSLIASFVMPGSTSQAPNPLKASTGKGYICNNFTGCPTCIPNTCHAVGAVWKDTYCIKHYICGPGGDGGATCSNNGSDFCWTTFTYSAAGCATANVTNYVKGGTFSYCGQ